MKKRKKIVRDHVVDFAISKIRCYMNDMTYDEIVEILPRVIDSMSKRFSEEEIDALIQEIIQYRS